MLNPNTRLSKSCALPIHRKFWSNMHSIQQFWFGKFHKNKLKNSKNG